MKEAVVVTIRPIPELFEKLAEETRALLPGTRAYPGCLTAHMCLNKERNEMVMFELWESPQTQEDYLTWRAERGDFEKLHAMLDVEPDFCTYCVD